MKKVQLAASAVLIVALTHCGRSSVRRVPIPADPSGESVDIGILPRHLVVVVNSSDHLRLRRMHQQSRPQPPFTWTSGNPEVLEVVSLGERARIVGLRAGATRVWLETANGDRAWTTVEVVSADLAEPPPNKSVQTAGRSFQRK